MYRPILAIKCHKCGAVYRACALAYGVDEEMSANIKQAIADGDEIFIAESVTLGVCECETNNTDKNDEY
jgi:hypothetical protein